MWHYFLICCIVCVYFDISLLQEDLCVCCWPVVFGNWSDNLSTINNSLNITISFSTRSVSLCVRFIDSQSAWMFYRKQTGHNRKCMCVCYYGSAWVGGLDYRISFSKDYLAIETNETQMAATSRSQSCGMLF